MFLLQKKPVTSYPHKLNNTGAACICCPGKFWKTKEGEDSWKKKKKLQLTVVEPEGTPNQSPSFHSEGIYVPVFYAILPKT